MTATGTVLHKTDCIYLHQLICAWVTSSDTDTFDQTFPTCTLFYGTLLQAIVLCSAMSHMAMHIYIVRKTHCWFTSSKWCIAYSNIYKTLHNATPQMAGTTGHHQYHLWPMGYSAPAFSDCSRQQVLLQCTAAVLTYTMTRRWNCIYCVWARCWMKSYLLTRHFRRIMLTLRN